MEANKDIINSKINSILNSSEILKGKSLDEIQSLLEEKKLNFKLIMSIVCKNEEDIIEQHIRFHKAMGVDGFIVLNNNSTDKTLSILEKLKDEGLVYEIITTTTQTFEQNTWIKEMIGLARNKYRADWIINADADEFYFSKSLNLKKSIKKASDANVIKVESIFLFPDNRDDYLSCPYFVTRPFYNFEVKLLELDKIDKNLKSYNYDISTDGVKVIHRFEGIKALHPGNHDIEMENKKMINSSDISIYHYQTKNYKGFEAKVLKWIDCIELIPGEQCWHIKRLVNIYNEGKLLEEYESKYNEKIRNFLMQNGVVTIDPSVYNFMMYKGIIEKKTSTS